MADQKDLSIVIVSWNVSDLLRACLRTIDDSANSSHLNVETIVVDSASTDGSPDMLRNDFPGVTLIARSENIGFTKGNNLNYSRLIPLPRAQAEKWVWLLFIPLIVVIVAAVSNGANLTDGLDGLATGVSGIVGLTLAIPPALVVEQFEKIVEARETDLGSVRRLVSA